MQIKAEEISSIIKEKIKGFDHQVDVSQTGSVIQVGDGIAKVYGLDGAMAGEMLEFPGGLYGIALNLEEDNVGAVLMGSDVGIKEGDPVKRTGRIAEVPVGEALIGRVVNPLGLEAVLPGGFTYAAAVCPATDRVLPLRAARRPDGRLGFTWDASQDPCFVSYRMYTAADPAAPPAFPADWTDATSLDEDGNPGGDASYWITPGTGTLVLWTVAAVGEDGNVGPP